MDCWDLNIIFGKKILLVVELIGGIYIFPLLYVVAFELMSLTMDSSLMESKDSTVTWK